MWLPVLCTLDQLLHLSQQPEEGGTVSVILQSRKQKCSEVKLPAQDDTASDTEAGLQTQAVWLGVPVLPCELLLPRDGHTRSGEGGIDTFPSMVPLAHAWHLQLCGQIIFF